MPRLKDMKNYNFGNFVFTGVRPDTLEEPEYTVVNIVTDKTGSISHFADEILEMEKQIIRDAKRPGYGQKLIVRATRFNSQEIEELHGFKTVTDIDIEAEYPEIYPSGMTPLLDAAGDGVAAVKCYCKELYYNDYTVNGLVVIVTDGLENYSKKTDMDELVNLSKSTLQSESMDSFKIIVIGINTSFSAQQDYTRFDVQGGDTIGDVLKRFSENIQAEFIDAGDVKEGVIGKVAGFISRSISSTSQALGTGAPSQKLDF